MRDRKRGAGGGEGWRTQHIGYSGQYTIMLTRMGEASKTGRGRSYPTMELAGGTKKAQLTASVAPPHNPYRGIAI